MHPSSTVNWPNVIDQVMSSDYSGAVPVTPFWFGNSKVLCDELTSLVIDGVKTATASLLWAWEQEGESLPAVGQRDVLLDWDNRIVGVIEITEICVEPFIEVKPEFARLEGEGDLSLDYWRKVHWDFFELACYELGKTMTEQAPVVCQRFDIVHSVSY